MWTSVLGNVNGCSRQKAFHGQLGLANVPFSCRISVHIEDSEKVYGKEIGLIYLKTEELWAIFPVLVLFFRRMLTSSSCTTEFFGTPLWEMSFSGLPPGLIQLSLPKGLPSTFMPTFLFETPGLPLSFLSETLLLQTPALLDLQIDLGFAQGSSFLWEEILEWIPPLWLHF